MFKRLIFLTLILLLFFDAWLFVVYFKPSLLSLQPTQISQSEKKFVSPDPTYQIPSGKVKEIFPGNLNQFAPPIVAFTSTLSGKPIVDKKNETVQIPISTLTSKGKKISASIILGKNQPKVSVLYTKEGVSGIDPIWFYELTSKLIPLLKEGDPIIVKIHSQRAPPSFFTDNRCDIDCKEYFQELNNNFNKNASFIKSLEGEIAPVDKLRIGPVVGLILYESP